VLVRLRWLALVIGALVLLLGAQHAQSAPTELFISEYIEGTSNNKALEIYNGTGAPVDLAAAGYSVQMFFNGAATAGLTINLTGTVANGDVYVLAQSSAGAAILAQADQTNGAGWFNGDDAVVLRHGTTTVDVIGQIGTDPGTEWGTGLTSAGENTLRRKPTIQAGDANGAGDVPLDSDVSTKSCTVAVDAAKVTDLDTDDPPDQPAANHSFTFTTTLPLTQIAQVQGASHLSPLAGQLVEVEGVVTAERGSNVWVQDTTPDADPATSEGILVFAASVANAVAVGDLVQVRGTVSEFRPGCFGCDATSDAFDNLTVTELVAPGLGVTVLGVTPLPAATVIGAGGREPPNAVIENDSASGNVETSNGFDPAQDGIDFYESLESMLVQVNDAVAVGPTNGFGEIFVVGDNGTNASLRTTRGGVVITANDLNPERIQLDDAILPRSTPGSNVGDHFSAPAFGILGYDFGNFELDLTSALATVPGSLTREATAAPADNQLAVATFNVENLAPTDPPAKFQRLAGLIVDHLRAPDVIAIEEIQDNDGVAGGTGSSVVDASITWNMLISAIGAAAGPHYGYRQIDPQDDQDGGAPGGNIRVGFLFRTDRGLRFVDRPGGDATTATQVVREGGRARLTLSPGRVDPLNPAWDATRKPLAGEFVWNDKTRSSRAAASSAASCTACRSRSATRTSSRGTHRFSTRSCSAPTCCAGSRHTM
jgi:uncharacterized protein